MADLDLERALAPDISALLSRLRAAEERARELEAALDAAHTVMVSPYAVELDALRAVAEAARAHRDADRCLHAGACQVSDDLALVPTDEIRCDECRAERRIAERLAAMDAAKESGR